MLLCTVWTFPSHRAVRELAQQVAGGGSGGPKVLRMCGTRPDHAPEGTRDLPFCRDPEEFGKEEQAAADKTVTQEAFQGEWAAPASQHVGPQPGATGGSKGAGALRASSAGSSRGLVCSSRRSRPCLGKNSH
ncbi:40S ribosomal protein SA-like [Felis catus]|uniref:40S ribosomal protein SA-like n=1 Tax=Felis catus TaxID=9685 RepID=UPI001D19C341|nr:40S ribosomal protein SA-like [Felis catus]